MIGQVYKYSFEQDVPFASVKSSLAFALMAVESLVGEPEMVLNIAHSIDAAERSVEIAGRSRAGRLLNKLFVGFVIREFGSESFNVQRIATPSKDEQQ